MKKIQVWMEGFAASGNIAKASLLGEYEAEDFDDAVRKYEKGSALGVQWNRFGPGRHAVWACELFDNEVDARKMKLKWFTVVSLHIETGRIEKSNRLAVSSEDALRLERAEFGEPVFRVLQAYQKIEV